MHLKSKHWLLTDYIIARQRDLPDFLNTGAARGANCSMNHIIGRPTTRHIIHKQFRKLKNVDTRNEFVTNLNKQLTLTTGTVENSVMYENMPLT